MSKWPEVGIHYGIDWETYRKLDAANNSFLWTLQHWSPLHAHYEREHPQESTPALLFGQALHARILEPAEWDKRYAVKPECDRRTTAGKTLYETFCATKGSRVEIGAGDYAKIVEVERSFRASTCNGLVKDGQHEVCLVWDDPETGVRMKARCDCVNRDEWVGDVIVDVKTTASARADDFRQSIYKYGYFQQAAVNCAGWEVLTGRTPEFTLLAIEKSPPFAAAAYPLGPATLDAGKFSFQSALRTYIECRKSGVWPGYQDKPTMLDMSDYHLRQEGVNQFQEHAEPVYAGGGVPEGQEESDFDAFLKEQ